MNVLPQLRRAAQFWSVRGTDVAATVRDLRAKAAPHLRKLERLAGSSRLMSWLLVPIVAVAIGCSLLPIDNAVSAGRDSHHGVSKLAAAVSVSRLQFGTPGSQVRGLPHGRSATVGVVPFAAAPPKHLKHDAVPLGASTGVPAVAIAAYQHAQIVLSHTDPTCHLSWEDVAGIGRVESDNGQTWGSAARITSNGTLFPPIYGIPLNGSNGTPAMPAPGGGWVRAEGPMQFLPATWAEYAQDGNGDGKRNPQNFYDAALTTGVFLCANGGNMNARSGLTAAILAYNHSDAYVALVESWISFYSHVGVTALAAAGNGLLPVGTPRTESPRTKAPAKPHTAAPPTASPATMLSTAALFSQAAGSYSFSLQALAGTSETAAGNGVVDTRDRTGSLVLQLPGSGSLQMRVIGGKTYLSLPPALASAAGAEGPWIMMTPTALSRLPAPLGSGLVLASKDLAWLVGQLSGATGMHVAGHARINGAAATEYAGQANLALAASHLPGSSVDLGRVADLAGSSHLGVTAWVSENRIQSAVISLGSFVAGEGPVSLHLSFMDYGLPVLVVAPTVSPILSSTTTTTTTTTAVPPTTVPGKG